MIRSQVTLAIALGLLLGRPAFAESSRELVGTYEFVREVRDVAGQQSIIEAKGVRVFDAGGTYTLTIIGPNVPKVASNTA